MGIMSSPAKKNKNFVSFFCYQWTNLVKALRTKLVIVYELTKDACLRALCGRLSVFEICVRGTYMNSD